MTRQIETMDCPCCGAAFPAVWTSSISVSHAGNGRLATNTTLNIKAFKTRAEAEREMRR